MNASSGPISNIAMNSGFALSLPRAEGPVFVLNQATLEHGLEASRKSPRGRIMLPLHRSPTEGVQRLLNFLQRGSYIRPHRHPKPENVENVVVLKGEVIFLIFDAEGRTLSSHRLIAGDPTASLIDIEQGVWHTLVPLTDDSVILEIKRGPYDAATDKEFASWSPAEGTAEAGDWLKQFE